MSISWPTANSFPQNVKIGSSRGYRDNNVKRTAMESGPDKLRLRDRTITKTVTATLSLNKVQTLQLETFYESDTSYGTLPFQFLDTANDTTYDFRFFQAPSYQHLAGDRWEASMILEQMP